MSGIIVLGNTMAVVSSVLQAIRGFTDQRPVVLGGVETLTLRRSFLCSRQHTVLADGSDDARAARLINELASADPDTILIPCDCDAIRMVNRLRSRLVVRTVPLPDTETLEMFNDKWRFHQFCTRQGLPVPDTLHFGAKQAIDFDALVAEFGLPIVIKPSNEAGSVGVKIIRSKAQYEREILNDPQYRFSPLVAQRYIDGEDIDISLLAMEGRLSAFAIQQAREPQIRFVPNAELAGIAEHMCRASGFHGVMHVDARIEARTGNLYLIESNPRFWASLTAAAWCGLNFVAEAVSQNTNGPVRQLTNGSFHTRHPVMRPSAWGKLVSDSGEHGRILRAMTFDIPTMSKLTRELPLKAWRFANARAASRFRRTSATLRADR